MPERVQRIRRKGEKGIPEGAIYVGRRGKWGNPFIVGRNYEWHPGADVPHSVPTNRPVGVYEHGIRVVCCTLETAITWHAAWLQGQDLSELMGKDLACWCPLTAPCHGDNLLAAANLQAEKATP